MSSLDLQKVKPLPIQKTIALINNFILISTNFLNNLSETCEKRLSIVSSKATELEILLAVLEAKLNSIPGLEFSENSKPGIELNLASKTIPTADTQNTTAQTTFSNPPDNSNNQNVNIANPNQTVNSPTEMNSHQNNSNSILAKDHPSYEPFFKMSRLGVPLQAVKNKVIQAGLNPDIIDDPEASIPL